MYKILPDNLLVPPKGNLRLILHFGFSSVANDWDNPIKPFQDILQKKYGFNDNRIYEAVVTKELVKRGNEFIYFKIEKLKE